VPITVKGMLQVIRLTAIFSLRASISMTWYVEGVKASDPY
jgi:hypothetical protein